MSTPSGPIDTASSLEDAITTLEQPEGMNVSATERGVSVTLGVALLAFAGARRRPLSSLVLAGFGAFLAHRGITGRCAMYEALDYGSLDDDEDDRLDAGAHDDGSVEAAVTVFRPVDEVYAFWRKLENVPRFMKSVESVVELDAIHSRWTARLPGGVRVEWDAEILEDRKGELIVWRSLPGSEVHHHGAVRFAQGPPGRGTEVRVSMEFQGPGGLLARTAARVLHRGPEIVLADDLRRLRQILEAGETATVDGQPRGEDEAMQSEDEEYA